jgi:hypothetical protein
MKVHALVVEAVVAPVLRGLAVAAEIFGHRSVHDIVLAGGRVELGHVQLRQQLGRGVELGGLGQVGDIARVDHQRRLFRHGIDQRDGLGQGADHVGIGLLVEADVGIADLQEQR